MASYKVKQRYAIIYNTFANSKLADVYSRRSDERIKNELGIVIPKKSTYVRPTRKFTFSERKAKQRELMLFLEQKYKLSTIEARKTAKRRTPKKPPKMTELKQQLTEIRNVKIQEIKDINMIARRNKEKTRAKRASQWAFWSNPKKGGVFPNYLQRMIYKLNLDADLDSEDSYGYCVIYQMYVNEYSLDDALAFVKPDPFMGYIYMLDERKRKKDGQK